MFLKAEPKGRESRLKESEKRRLRERILKRYPTVSEEQLNLVLPLSKQSELSVVKLTKREEIYRVGGKGGSMSQPVFLGIDGERVGLVPTCYTLHLAPQMLRQVLVHKGVATKVCRGADLFLPGVVAPEDLQEKARLAGVDWPELVFGGKWEKGETCALVTVGEWAPFAVGQFAMDYRDVLEWGMERGTAVTVLHCVGDKLWETGSRAKPPAEPPAAAVQAVEDFMRRQEEAAQAVAAKQRQEKVEEIGRRLKKLEKALRQIELTKEKGDQQSLNAEQLSKVAKEPELRGELEALVGERNGLMLAALGTEGAPRGDAVDEWEELVGGQMEAKNGSEGGATDAAEASIKDVKAVGAEEELGAGIEEVTLIDEEGKGEGEGYDAEEAVGLAEEGAAATQEEVDDLYLRAFLSVLSNEKLPVLANVAFGKVAKYAPSFTIKETTWKKAGKFLESNADAIKTRPVHTGVLEVIGVSTEQAALLGGAPFHPLPEAVLEDDEGSWAEGGGHRCSEARASKRGGTVTVHVRKVRNKNVTFIDGLDSWGFSKEAMGEIAKDFRKRFSASASVGERKGATGKKQFWSIQVQGKYIDQVRAALQERGIDGKSITLTAKNGLVSKKDRAANV